MSGCRIRSVKDKLTGRSLTLLDTRPYEGNALSLVQNARTVAEMFQGDLDAYVVIGIGGDGAYSIGWRTGGIMGPTLLAAYISEIVRREAPTQAEAVAVVNRSRLVE